VADLIERDKANLKLVNWGKNGKAY
jgi:hypothetical protein